jgi:nicotinate-nucleotide--dimethylbenzimidazole phosphoribosyltransferase
MPAASRSLIAPTANALLERALREKLGRRNAEAGSLGELEPLALRLGLLQNTLKPRLHDPQLVIVASDHGLAVDGIVIAPGRSTADEVHKILTGRLPVAVLAAAQGLNVTVVDAGVADRVTPHERLLIRKIAHGTRNPRLTQAMSLDQAHAAIRAGMEIAEHLPGNAVACAGIGVGGEVSAALVIAKLSGLSARDLFRGSSKVDGPGHARLAVLAQAALTRHREVNDPVEVLAAVGGFEIATLAGLMLVAAQQRHLVMVDGLAACAALMVASRVAEAVTDYCVFCRSQQHEGLDTAMRLFGTGALLELNLNCTDGSGAALSWPLVRAASALLTEVAEGEEAGPTLPGNGLLDLGIGAPAAAPDSSLFDTLTRRTRHAKSAATDDAHVGDTLRADLGDLPEAHASSPTGARPGKWHSAFDQGENGDASAKVDTHRDETLPSP